MPLDWNMQLTLACITKFRDPLKPIYRGMFALLLSTFHSLPQVRSTGSQSASGFNRFASENFSYVYNCAISQAPALVPFPQTPAKCLARSKELSRDVDCCGDFRIQEQRSNSSLLE